VEGASVGLAVVASAMTGLPELVGAAVGLEDRLIVSIGAVAMRGLPVGAIVGLEVGSMGMVSVGAARRAKSYVLKNAPLYIALHEKSHEASRTSLQIDTLSPSGHTVQRPAPLRTKHSFKLPFSNKNSS